MVCFCADRECSFSVHIHACQGKWTGQFQDSFAGLEALAEDLHGDIVILAHDQTGSEGGVQLVELVHDRDEVFVDEASRTHDRDFDGSDGDVHECRWFVCRAMLRGIIENIQCSIIVCLVFQWWSFIQNES